MSRPKIIKVVSGVHMGLGHKGLRKLLNKQAGINLDDVQGKDLVFCLNGHGDKLKVIGCKGLVLAYLNLNGRKIMREALQYIPRTFGAGGFDYDAACVSAITEKFPAVVKAGRTGPLAAARAARQAGL